MGRNVPKFKVLYRAAWDPTAGDYRWRGEGGGTGGLLGNLLCLPSTLSIPSAQTRLYDFECLRPTYWACSMGGPRQPAPMQADHGAPESSDRATALYPSALTRFALRYARYSQSGPGTRRTRCPASGPPPPHP
jgi:hypothetical protein